MRVKLFFFFFFKQKTAYEMLRSLVGSEMCIRDSTMTWHCNEKHVHRLTPDVLWRKQPRSRIEYWRQPCLSLLFLSLTGRKHWPIAIGAHVRVHGDVVPALLTVGAARNVLNLGTHELDRLPRVVPADIAGEHSVLCHGRTRSVGAAAARDNPAMVLRVQSPRTLPV
eukprot:TRINITY_DN633_c0_g1_i3.p1 TRINITY_DN633_c0_g1~~TRINITY_DN633_c0_g1_i3.p1  ORF type:complete len:167 (-),score=16.63 TRINITY_DN633_c0_g1_i3:264-764(-)